MRLLKIVSFFVLVTVINSQTYDELARDECFKKVYLCGDYRSSVTGGGGRLATEPHRFSEICRKHKEFIACIEQSADFCSGKLTNVSRVVLDNRRSLNLFCTDLKWKRNYFSSVRCINDNEKAVLDECNKEENEYEEDRTHWCLLPEPCVALERVFMCSIRKMKQLCGSVAAEVHRRMHILKVENRDIVCAIRQRNPIYCRYKHQKQSQTEFMKRMGSLSVALSEAINNIFESVLVDTMDNFALLLNEENISNLLDSDEYKLRKEIFKSEVEEKFSHFFTKGKLPGDQLLQQPDLSIRSFNLIFRNIKQILSKAISQSSKFSSDFYGNISKLCGMKNVALSSCLEDLKELESLKPRNPMASISKELIAGLKSLKDYILGLFELLNCNEDFLVKSISENATVVTWDNMDSFPLQTLSCGWKNGGFKKLFQCSFKLKSEDLIHEPDGSVTELDGSVHESVAGMQPDIMESTTVESTMAKDNINEFIRPFVVETSLFTDSGSGMEDFLVSIPNQDMALDFPSTDTQYSETDAHDIRRSGQQIRFQEEMDLGEFTKRVIHDTKLKSFDESKQNEKKLPEESLESSTSSDFEKQNLRFQMNKIVDALSERFASVEVKVSESETSSKPDFRKRQKLENINFQSYYPDKVSINKSFQTELKDFLKEKLKEHRKMY